MIEAVKNILPGAGLGDVKFGMSPNQVEAILGKPDETEMGEFEVPNEEGEAFVQTWHYDKAEISMEFEKLEDKWRLIVLSVTGEKFEYNKQTLIGKPWVDLQSHLSDLHLAKDETEEENIAVLFSSLLNISFWFEDDILTEVQWTQLLPDVALN